MIFDFTSNPDGKDNFKLMKPSDFKVKDILDILPDERSLMGVSSFLFELPIEFGGTLDSAELKKAKDNLMVFDIKTGAEQAQKLFDEAQ